MVPGDEVITTPHTFFATAGSISRLGAKPVFVDIEADSFNLNVKEVEAKITGHTKAIMPVHLFGQSAEMKPLTTLCSKKNIPLVEDAAQAIGAEYQGKRVGSLGTIGCFSFFPSKNLGALGDGGIVTTNDEALAEKMRSLRSHGSKPKYYHKWIGGNFRLDPLQAAIVSVKLDHLDAWTKKRQNNADRYDALIKERKLDEFVIAPWRRAGDRHIFNQYVLRVKKRGALRDHLKKEGIGTEIYYPVPMHLQECFSGLKHKKGDFPEAEKAAEESLAIPVYPGLTSSQQEQVIDTIEKFFKA